MDLRELHSMEFIGLPIVVDCSGMDKSIMNIVIGTIVDCRFCCDGIEIVWHHWPYHKHRWIQLFSSSCWQCRLADNWIFLDRVSQELPDQTLSPFHKVNQYAILRKADH